MKKPVFILKRPRIDELPILMAARQLGQSLPVGNAKASARYKREISALITKLSAHLSQLD